VSYRKLPYEGAIECPHCELLRCWCHVPQGNERVSFQACGTNLWFVYECKACHAMWTLGDSSSWFDGLPHAYTPPPTREEGLGL
jgi:hypothetical protein